ncbi:hypothetical protein B484DRAFT_266126 [Ochromonadaceae sp. CCMP2298]|nr:hypothetical protein B484DRAFT_266126 [Ochromonadaceae sp. CCMP2298]
MAYAVTFAVSHFGSSGHAATIKAKKDTPIAALNFPSVFSMAASTSALSAVRSEILVASIFMMAASTSALSVVRSEILLASALTIPSFSLPLSTSRKHPLQY